MKCKCCDGAIAVEKFRDESNQMDFYAYECHHCRKCTELPVAPDKLHSQHIGWIEVRHD